MPSIRCRGDDARLTIENALDAAYHGGAIANYVELEGFSRAEGRIRGGRGTRPTDGRRFELRARLFINAAGPWIDDVRRLDDPGVTPSVRLTKGVHLVIDRERLPVRSAGAGRRARPELVFVIPHGEEVLVGTTDTDFHGDRERPAAEPEDIDYLLGVVSQSLPGAALTVADVAASFAGLRALAAGGASAPSSVSREEVIVESRSGLISIAGGKLTTHREIAERIVNRALSILGRGQERSPTLDTPLPGARPVEIEDMNGAAQALAALPTDLRERDDRALRDSGDRGGRSSPPVARAGTAARRRMPGRGGGGALRGALRDGGVGRGFHPAPHRALVASSATRIGGGRGGGAPDGGRTWMGPGARAGGSERLRVRSIGLDSEVIIQMT